MFLPYEYYMQTSCLIKVLTDGWQWQLVQVDISFEYVYALPGSKSDNSRHVRDQCVLFATGGIVLEIHGYAGERSREMVQSDGAPQCFLQPESVDETSHPEPAMSRSLTASCRTSEGGSIVLSERDVLIRSTCTINIMLILKLPPKAC